MRQLNPIWVANIDKAIDAAISHGQVFQRTISEPLAKKQLVLMLAEKKIQFTVKNLGCGVAMITTNTTTCPFCGREHGGAK